MAQQTEAQKQARRDAAKKRRDAAKLAAPAPGDSRDVVVTSDPRPLPMRARPWFLDRATPW